MKEFFDLQRFVEGGGGRGGGSPPEGEGGGSSSSSVTYSGATEITTAGTYSNQTYTSTTANKNSVLITVGGTINNTSGHIFHVTNTTAVITLSDVTINDSGAGVLLSVCDDGWSGASNVATLNAVNQEITGDILVGENYTLTLNLTEGTVFTGIIDGNITNNAGTV